VTTFRELAFTPALPHLLPQGAFTSLPAKSKWFCSAERNTSPAGLNFAYLSKFDSTSVPLELTSFSGASADSKSDGQQQFSRGDFPLSFFLDYVEQATSEDHGVNHQGNIPGVYLAQCPLSSLPSEMNDDVPTPCIVKQAGRGDIYDSSIWIGLAPTYTPLHKDPNPNLFVQLAGKKVIRLLEPAIGNEIYAEVQRGLKQHGSAAIRDEKMMLGPEKELLDEAVWGTEARAVGYEAVLKAGDGIFVPKGWWHSVKGVGTGIIGSVRFQQGLPNYSLLRLS